MSIFILFKFEWIALECTLYPMHEKLVNTANTQNSTKNLPELIRYFNKIFGGFGMTGLYLKTLQNIMHCWSTFYSCYVFM